MHHFLQDYRANIVGVMKKYSGVAGKVAPESRKLLEQIVNAYVALMSMTDFIEV